MAWLLSGVLYCVGYLGAGLYLRPRPDLLLWFRLIALLVPPATALAVIVRRRRDWSGCEWLFWATIALGLFMSAVGLVGWTMDAMLVGQDVSWLGWYAVFALFGTITPLLALLSQPHRGPRPALMATTAVDIAGIAVMTGFLYSRFLFAAGVSTPGATDAGDSLVLLSEFQQVLVFIAVALAAFFARNLPWALTYRRLALGLLVNLALLSIAHVEIRQGLYRAGFVYDFVWILPFAFYAWAAASAPSSPPAAQEETSADTTPARPWVVFGAVAIIPLLDLALRPALPRGAFSQYGDLFTAMTILSVLPLLMARLAVERSGMREAEDKRRLLSTALEQADDLVLISDPAGGVEHANAAFCRALGYDRSDVSQMKSVDFVATESIAELQAADAAVQGGDTWRGTLVHRRHDGTEFTAAAAVVPLYQDERRIAHLVAVERDMTRDLQLRDQLIHRERLAATGQLVAGVAHELNNPLQSIIGFAELLMLAERREEVRTDLQHVRHEAERAAAIVRNLLSFVRRAPAERQDTDLNELVRATVALRAYELRRGGIKVEERYDPDVPSVSVHRGEIQQVLLNLILNAEQAMTSANGKGYLRVSTRRLPSGVIVDVQDDGPGVPADVEGRIFEPFFTTKEVGQGTGLGLSLAFGISKSHGGSLTLEPSTTGACFRLSLPAAAICRTSLEPA